jgi:hypothetical protein
MSAFADGAGHLPISGARSPGQARGVRGQIQIFTHGKKRFDEHIFFVRAFAHWETSPKDKPLPKQHERGARL